jgi:hypothetical protein
MPRARQQKLPGTPAGIPELEEIGIEVASIDEESWKLRGRREFLVKKGLEEMHKNNVTKYEVEGITLELVPGVDKLKVRKKDSAQPETDAA